VKDGTFVCIQWVVINLNVVMAITEVEWKNLPPWVQNLQIFLPVVPPALFHPGFFKVSNFSRPSQVSMWEQCRHLTLACLCKPIYKLLAGVLMAAAFVQRCGKAWGQ